MPSIREQQVINHLKENRPKMYAELQKSNQLEATAKRMWEDYTAELADLVHKKVPYDQAQELCRERAFPPGEEDQPRLGEKSLRTIAETTS